MRIEVTDNLFLTSTDTNTEPIATYGPTLNLNQHGKLLDLNLDYTYEVQRFLAEPELNDNEHTHRGNLAGTLLPGRNFSIELSADATLVAIDRRRSDIVETSRLNTTSRYAGRGRPVYRFKLGSTLSGEIAYVFEQVEYEAITADDTESHTAQLLLEKTLSSTLKMRLAGEYEWFFPTLHLDFERHQGLFGFIWNPNSRLEMTALGGLAGFEFENQTSYDSAVADSHIHIETAGSLNMDFGYSVDFVYDITDGVYQLRTGEGSISGTGRLGWKLGYIYRDYEFIQTVRDDLDQGPFAEISYRATRKILLQLKGESRQLEFEPITENVDRYNIEASFRYAQGDRTSLECRYVYRNNDSDIELKDYVENLGFCELRWAFALIR